MTGVQTCALPILVLALLFCVTICCYAQEETPLVAPAPEETKTVGDEEDFNELMAKFTQPDVDLLSMSKELLPKDEDYKAYFTDDLAEKIASVYQKKWKREAFVVCPEEKETEIVIWKTTVEDLKKYYISKDKELEAKHFPGNYKKVVDMIAPNTTIYCVKFIVPTKKEEATEKPKSFWGKQIGRAHV